MALKPNAVSACPAAASVLVADDDPETCRLVANALGLRHDQIRRATDGRVALALALGSAFSCVITETTLPFIDGYALCELLRTDSATRSTPILVVTAEERTGLLARALQAGANAVLTKPVPPETLRAEIDRLMRATHDRHEHAEPCSREGTKRLANSDGVSHRPHTSGGRRNRNHHFERFPTTNPPIQAPLVLCPTCAHLLTYQTSHVGGVSASFAEQWDYYDCPTGCGQFRYRHRTRKLRAL